MNIFILFLMVTVCCGGCCCNAAQTWAQLGVQQMFGGRISATNHHRNSRPKTDKIMIDRRRERIVDDNDDDDAHSVRRRLLRDLFG